MIARCQMIQTRKPRQDRKVATVAIICRCLDYLAITKHSRRDCPQVVLKAKDCFLAYLSLARKYRPQKFSQIIGQDAVVQALTKAIELKREAHGVILTGVRGIGKTTIARLYAKALNCENASGGDPCDQCASCIAINNGIHEDVLEIDGASNTSVEDVRTLKETVDYVSQRSPYKVYIIDEVHMLSQSAFNALLKTLEEPPKHVVFVFATTELNKVPQTIISRCQTFFLKKFSLEDVVGRIKEILQIENIPFEAEALPMIAKAGQGSMRDSLTILDQVLAFNGGAVKLDAVVQFVDCVGPESCLQLLGALIQKDSSMILSVVKKWDEAGYDFTSAIEELCLLARHAFIVKELGVNHLDIATLSLNPEHLKNLAEIAEKAETLDLNRVFRTLAKCRGDLDGSQLDKCIVENYLLEWCLDPGLPMHVAQNTAPTVAEVKSAPKKLDFKSLKNETPMKPVEAAPASAPMSAKEFPRTW